MGVTGSGKTAVVTALAPRLGLRPVDGDDLHPAANVARMAAGTPLTDEDRSPWLDQVADELQRGGVVVACSALARRHRDRLRAVGGVEFVHLAVDAGTAQRRVAGRTGHFMGADMVAGQVAALEPPGAEEPDVAVVDATVPLAPLVVTVLERLTAP